MERGASQDRRTCTHTYIYKTHAAASHNSRRCRSCRPAALYTRIHKHAMSAVSRLRLLPLSRDSPGLDLLTRFSHAPEIGLWLNSVPRLGLQQLCYNYHELYFGKRGRGKQSKRSFLACSVAWAPAHQRAIGAARANERTRTHGHPPHTQRRTKDRGEERMLALLALLALPRNGNVLGFFSSSLL